MRKKSVYNLIDGDQMHRNYRTFRLFGKRYRFTGQGAGLRVGLLAIICLILSVVGISGFASDAGKAIYENATRPAPTFVKQKVRPGKVVRHSDETYTYGDMKKDLEELEERYPDRVTLSSIGKSLDGRNIFCLTLGDPNAKKTVLVDAGLHAREYINCQVTMAIIDMYCRKYDEKKYDGKTIHQILKKTKICFLPMLNPDGVTISQFGKEKIKSEELKAELPNIPRTGDYSNWKANARGVDLNRNFSTGWSEGSGQVGYPNSEGYYGKSAESEPETKAFVDFVQETKPLAAINLHSMGNLVYWGAKGEDVSDDETKLLEIVLENTDYTTSNEDYYDGKGDAEHWLRSLHIPYVCIENGVGYLPISHDQFEGIYEKNRDIPIQIAREFGGRGN